MKTILTVLAILLLCTSGSHGQGGRRGNRNRNGNGNGKGGIPLPVNNLPVNNGPLRPNYYANTCPQAEQLVREAVAEASQVDPNLPSALIRLHFHDCFVGACDASVLLLKNAFGTETEMDSPGNKVTSRGMEIIDNAKARIEAVCPATVSCADILAYAARDAVALYGLQQYAAEGGRLDALNSIAKETMKLPGTGLSPAQMTATFAKRGLTQEEVVVLLGAHSVGQAHCSTFLDRINYLDLKQYTDKSIDPDFHLQLKEMCPKPLLRNMFSEGKLIHLDPTTPYKLDVEYYKNVLAKRGLLRSDNALLNDPNTKALVEEMAANPDKWAEKFAATMIKLGRVGVEAGGPGEIRRDCRYLN